MTHSCQIKWFIFIQLIDVHWLDPRLWTLEATGFGLVNVLSYTLITVVFCHKAFRSMIKETPEDYFLLHIIPGIAC